MLVVFSGLSAGAIHVVSGPDHLAALAPLAVDDPDRGAKLGFRWGLGHGLGALLLGLLGLIAKQLLDIEAVSGGAEALVGFVLIGVGLWTWRNAGRPTVSHHHERATFLVGMLHGVAGTGHLLAVVPSMALEPAAAVVYLFAYLAAAVGVMTAVGAGLGRVAGLLEGPGAVRFLKAMSVLAIVVGLYWIALAGGLV